MAAIFYLHVSKLFVRFSLHALNTCILFKLIPYSLCNLFTVCIIVTGSAEMRGWLDSSMYEILIPSSVQLNEALMMFNLTMTQYFRYRVNCSSDCIISDVSFHLKSSYHYFYIASEALIPLNFLDNKNMFVPIVTESVELLSAINGHIPLNDYEMKIEVITGNTSLLSSDIVIHVVESLPALPVPG